jgi:fused
MLDRHGFVPLLVERFSDPDVSVRKYACFAFGNAAFHDDSLYPKLAPGIVPLVKLLSDKEPKTRLNAAGALGNLARNGPGLVAPMLQADAVAVRH